MRTHSDSVRISHLRPEIQMQVSEWVPYPLLRETGEGGALKMGIWPQPLGRHIIPLGAGTQNLSPMLQKNCLRLLGQG
jgi:hypothetical protein